MRKIISLFQRNYEGDHLVRDEIVPGAEWVVAGEGIATRKWDGTAIMVRDGKLYRRYDCKKGKTPPPFFEPAMDPDPVTGHWAGWIPVGNGPEDKLARDAVESGVPADGSYELCGPKVGGDPEQVGFHILLPHGKETLEAPRTFEALKEFFSGPGKHIEGIVWHHPDGRMVKIKLRDFGLKRERVPLPSV